MRSDRSGRRGVSAWAWAGAVALVLLVLLWANARAPATVEAPSHAAATEPQAPPVVAVEVARSAPAVDRRAEPSAAAEESPVPVETPADRPLHDVAVRVVDEDGDPVEGAEAWLTRRWRRLDQLPPRMSDRHGRSDAEGLVALRAEPGKFFLHVHHPDLVHAPNSVVECVVVVEGPTECRAELRHPWVQAFVIEGEEPVSWSLRPAKARDWLIWNQPDPSTESLARHQRALEAAHPDIRSWLMLSKQPEASSGFAELWFAGKERLEVEVPFVRLDRFDGPTVISAADTKPSADWGEALVTLVDPDDRPLATGARLCRVTPSSPTVDVRVIGGTPRVVPIGTYMVRFDDPILTRLARATRLEVRAGERTEARIAVPIPLRACEVTIASSPGTRWSKAQLRITHPHPDVGAVRLAMPLDEAFAQVLPLGAVTLEVVGGGGPTAVTTVFGEYVPAGQAPGEPPHPIEPQLER